MPAAVMTWRRSALGTVAATNVSSALAGLKALIDADVASNPTTALWQVADYSLANGTLVLKNTAAGITAGGVSTRRLMLFGGSIPNTAASDGADNIASYMYCGVAPTANVDAPQQAYTTGAPFTTGSWVPGGILMTTYTGIDRVEYWETFAGMVVVFRAATMTSANRVFTAILGGLAVTIDGATERDMATGSVVALISNNDSSTPTTGNFFPGIPAAGTPDQRCNYVDGLGIKRCYRVFYMTNTGGAAAMRGSGSDRFFFPYILRDAATAVCQIKSRQMGFGIREAYGTSMSDSGGVKAWKIAERTDQVGDGPWLTNVAI